MKLPVTSDQSKVSARTPAPRAALRRPSRLGAALLLFALVTCHTSLASFMSFSITNYDGSPITNDIIVRPVGAPAVDANGNITAAIGLPMRIHLCADGRQTNQLQAQNYFATNSPGPNFLGKGFFFRAPQDSGPTVYPAAGPGQLITGANYFVTLNQGTNAAGNITFNNVTNALGFLPSSADVTNGFIQFLDATNVSSYLTLASSNSLYSDYTTKIAVQSALTQTTSNALYTGYTTAVAVVAALEITNVYGTNLTAPLLAGKSLFIPTNWDAAGLAAAVGANATNLVNSASNALQAQIVGGSVTAGTATNIAAFQAKIATNGYTTLAYTNPATVLYTSSLPGLTNNFAALLDVTNIAAAATNGYTTLARTNPAAVLYTNSLPALTNRFVVNTNGVSTNETLYGPTLNSPNLTGNINANGGVFTLDDSGNMTAEKINLGSLGPLTLLKADSSLGIASVANGTGALTNNGSGVFGFLPLPTFGQVTNIVNGFGLVPFTNGLLRVYTTNTVFGTNNSIGPDLTWGIAASNSFIGGGIRNTNLGGSYSFIGGGSSNRMWSDDGAGPDDSFIGGGYQNSMGSELSVIVGGQSNYMDGGFFWMFMGGGAFNRINLGSVGGTLVGGENNWVDSAEDAFLGGGFQNQIHGDGTDEESRGAAILGGISNVIGSVAGSLPLRGAAILGGESNMVVGNYSVAAGLRSSATNDGSFVWSDGFGGAHTTGSNQFVAQANGGFYFQGGIIKGNGAALTNTSSTNLAGAALSQVTNIANSVTTTAAGLTNAYGTNLTTVLVSGQRIYIPTNFDNAGGSNTLYGMLNTASNALASSSAAVSSGLSGAKLNRTNDTSYGQTATNLITEGNVSFGLTGQATNIISGTNFIAFYNAGTAIATNGAFIWNSSQAVYTNWLTGAILTYNGSAWLLQTNGVALYSLSTASPIGTYSAVFGSAPLPTAVYSAAINDHMVLLGYFSVTNLNQLITNTVIASTNGFFIGSSNGFGTNTYLQNPTLVWSNSPQQIARLNFDAALFGNSNTLSGSGFGSTILSGISNNIANSGSSVIAGGEWNGLNSTVQNFCGIGGGQSNTISGNNYTHIGGGGGNSVTLGSDYSVIAGGQGNIINGQTFLGLPYSAILGGQYNSIVPNGNSYRGAVILGGQSNSVAGFWSAAAGRNVSVVNSGVFAWSDGSPFTSTTNSQFDISATNGLYLVGPLRLAGSAMTNAGVYYPSNTFSLFGVTNGMQNFSYWQGSSNGVLVTIFLSNNVPYMKANWP
jgi:hypothetical protein